jgi:probable HAF family extracellular repeat protein
VSQTALKLALVIAFCTVSLCSAQQYKNGAKPMVYQLNDLGLTTPEYPESAAMDINDRRQIVGNLYNPAHQPNGFFRDTDGTVQMIPSGSSSMHAYVRKVSALGTATGYIYGDFPARAFRWSASAGLLTLSFGEQSYGYGINSVGDVVGSVYLNGKERAFYWDHTGNAYELGTIDSSSLARTTAYAINDVQQVTGFAVGADGVARAFVWSPGSAIRILLPQYQNSIAYAISNSGRITGTVQTKQGWRAFIYDTISGETNLYGPHNVDSTAYGIEYSGVAVGQSAGQAAMFLSLKAFDLNERIEGGTSWQLKNAQAINTRGEIAGSAVVNGRIRAFLLTPTF